MLASVEEAIASVDRRRYLPAEFCDAPSDFAVPFGDNQTVPTAAITQLFFELAELDEDDVVLEIGTGSGYQAAILALLVLSVHTVEVRDVPPEVVDKLPCNVTVYHRDGIQNPPNILFDKLLVTCGVPYVMDTWMDSLREGGIAVIPVALDGGGCAVRKYIRQAYAMEDCGDFAYAQFVPAAMPLAKPSEARCK